MFPSTTSTTGCMLCVQMCCVFAGQLTSAVVSFTGLLSEVNEEPEFVLTCRSEGGPATTVQWTRDSTTISDPSTVLRLVDRQQNTVYESRLTVTGRDLVDYSCTVSSNRVTYFGEAGSSVSSEAFTVSGELEDAVCSVCGDYLSPRTASGEPTRDTIYCPLQNMSY